MSTSRVNPPTQWLQDVTAIDVGIGIYAWPSPDENTNHPTIWHWCTENERWQASGTRGHTLVGVDPLHLEPSLLFPCCGLHGWIRDGKWVSA